MFQRICQLPHSYHLEIRGNLQESPGQAMTYVVIELITFLSANTSGVYSPWLNVGFATIPSNVHAGKGY